MQTLAGSGSWFACGGDDMTLRAWSARHGFTYNTAAAALGVSRSTYRRLLLKDELPKLVQLAMKRIDDEKGMK